MFDPLLADGSLSLFHSVMNKKKFNLIFFFSLTFLDAFDVCYRFFDGNFYSLDWNENRKQFLSVSMAFTACCREITVSDDEWASTRKFKKELKSEKFKKINAMMKNPFIAKSRLNFTKSLALVLNLTLRPRTFPMFRHLFSHFECLFFDNRHFQWRPSTCWDQLL